MEAYKRRVFFMLIILLSVFSITRASDVHVIDSGATAWMLTSTALVLLMIPGLAMFYGGLVRSKNVLGTIMHSFAAMGIMSVLWVAVNDDFVDIAIETIIKAARTSNGKNGAIGDGKIFIMPLEQCIRIRRGEIGNSAI